MAPGSYVCASRDLIRGGANQGPMIDQDGQTRPGESSTTPQRRTRREKVRRVRSSPIHRIVAGNTEAFDPSIPALGWLSHRVEVSVFAEAGVFQPLPRDTITT